MTAERSDVKVKATFSNHMSDYQRKLRKSVNLSPIYFDQVETYINNRIEDEELRDKVMQIARKYPHSALSRFISNFSNIVNECQNKLNAEKNINTQKRVVPVEAEITADDLADIQSSLDEEWMSKSADLPKNDVEGKIDDRDLNPPEDQ